MYRTAGVAGRWWYTQGCTGVCIYQGGIPYHTQGGVYTRRYTLHTQGGIYTGCTPLPYPVYIQGVHLSHTPVYHGGIPLTYRVYHGRHTFHTTGCTMLTSGYTTGCTRLTSGCTSGWYTSVFGRKRDNVAHYTSVFGRKRGTMRRVLSPFFGRFRENEARSIPLSL